VDSYKAGPSEATLLLAILAGPWATGIGYYVNSALIHRFQNDLIFYSHYHLAPREETLKALVVIVFFP